MKQKYFFTKMNKGKLGLRLKLQVHNIFITVRDILSIVNTFKVFQYQHIGWHIIPLT